jgi:hypothetical protein
VSRRRSDAPHAGVGAQAKLVGRYLLDPAVGQRVHLSSSVPPTTEVADMAAFHAVMESEAGAEAMKYDGVRPDTLVVYVEA